MPHNAAAPAPAMGAPAAVGMAATRARPGLNFPGWRGGLSGRRQMLTFSHRSEPSALLPSVGRVMSAGFQPAADTAVRVLVEHSGAESRARSVGSARPEPVKRLARAAGTRSYESDLVLELVDSFLLAMGDCKFLLRQGVPSAWGCRTGEWVQVGFADSSARLPGVIEKLPGDGYNGPVWVDTCLDSCRRWQGLVGHLVDQGTSSFFREENGLSLLPMAVEMSEESQPTPGIHRCGI